MGLTKPFAFLGTSGPAVFDPTLGGTITPYFWYDFTDTDTMTIVGNEIREIHSKGSNVGSLAKGDAVSPTKYITNYVPVTLQTDDGNYALFSGSATNNTNSTLARRYGTGIPKYDGNFGDDSPATSIVILKPNWNSVTSTSWNRVVSFKGHDVHFTVKQPEEWTPVAMSINTSYAGNTYTATGSYATSNVDSIQIQSLDASTNSTVRFSYSGSGDVTNGELNYYHSAVARLTSTGGAFATAEYGRGTGEYQSTSFNGPRDGSNSSHEGYVIGSRSRTDGYQGSTFKIRHALLYDTTLTDTQITNVLNSYKAAYPQDNLNGS